MEKITKNSSRLAFLTVIALICSWGILSNAGNLNPSAPPGPTMKTLDEVEARIPVQSLSGSGTALYVISQSGSYYLTGNITTAETDKHGIEITVDDVTIDLNGYALIGPGKTTGSSGYGIYASGQRVTVLNGSVCQWRGGGILLGGLANQVRYIKTVNNGGKGIDVQKVSNVSHCTCTSNNGDGIYAWDGSVVSYCISYENSGNGVHGRVGVIVKECSIYQNEDSEGISVGKSSVINSCSIAENWDGDGILAGYGSVITDCAVYDNDDGIYAVKLTIKGCNFHSNGYAGIDASDCLIHGNSSTGHTVNLNCGGGSSCFENHAP